MKNCELFYFENRILNKGTGTNNNEWYLHPTNITHIVNIFSISVLGATLPNPTDVKDEKVK